MDYPAHIKNLPRWQSGIRRRLVSGISKREPVLDRRIIHGLNGADKFEDDSRRLPFRFSSHGDDSPFAPLSFVSCKSLPNSI